MQNGTDRQYLSVMNIFSSFALLLNFYTIVTQVGIFKMSMIENMIKYNNR